MKNMKAIIFTLLLVLMSPAVLALVWEDPYWLPEQTSNPNTIAFGGTATAASGTFFSIDPVVHYRAELRTGNNTLIKVLEEHDVDISVFTGYETVEVAQSDYVAAGDYLVRFTISDSHETRYKTLRLTVSAGPANNPPVLNFITDKIVYENSLLQFTISGSDPDGDSISFSASGLPSGATFNPTTRRFSWTPNFDQAGVYFVTFVVTDEHGATDSQRVRITVLNTNRCPVLSPIGGRTVSEGQLLTFMVSASDADAEGLTFSASGLPAGASFNAATRTLRWTPNYTQAGVYDVTFTVTDGDCPDSETIRITVVDDSTPAVTLTAVPTSGPEGLTVSFVCVATGGDAPLSYRIAFGDGVSVNSSTATHRYGVEGEYVAVCTVTDNDGDFGSDSELINVTDNIPVVDLRAAPSSGEAPLDVDFVCDVVGGNAPYVYMIEFGDGSFEISSTAHHVYASEGLYVATCTVIDVDGDVGSDTVGIDVSENACPVLDWPGDRVVTVGDVLIFTLSASDADVDALEYSAEAPFSAFVDPITGLFSWAPVALQVGHHTAVFSVTDGRCSDSVSIDINVLPAGPDNHAPEAEFNWTPAVPDAGEVVNFTSTSSDTDGDVLSCSWDFDDDGWSDSDDCVAGWVFGRPGDHPVTLTVSDGELSDSVTHIITVIGQLNVTSIECFSPVIELEHSLQSCTVHVESSHGTSVGGANTRLYYEDGTRISNCITDMLTGSCLVTFAVGPVGNYTVYATAEKPGWLPDLDADPTDSFEVLAQRYLISNLAVYNDSAFSWEDYDFFRGEDMYVNFMVLDEMGRPADDMVTSVALVSPPGGRVWFDEFAHAYAAGNYWYHLEIPITHDFLGDSQVFTFAFNFSDGSGAQMVVEVVIRNNPPVIDLAVADEFDRTFDDVTVINLTPYESDVEDSGRALQWSVLGVDPAVAEVSVDIDDFLTVTPVGAGYDIVTLVLTDLDGDTDMIDVPINTGGVAPLPECSDGLDNDVDGFVDMADPGCADPSDDDESDEVAPQCSDGLDNDADGIIDWPLDPGCDNSSDDDETDPVVLPQCADGLDNDADGLVDLADPGCADAADDDETDPVHTPECLDGVDNDGDGLIDLADPGCENPHDDDETDPVVLPACADGLDNDADGLIDMADPDCSAPGDDSEEHVPECSDGLDNDADGFVDLADPGCSGSGDDDESDDPVVMPQCHDGIDNDADGLVDWPADPGCSDLSDDDETDIAGNQPPIADLRLSRAYGAPTLIVDVDGSHSYDPDGSIVEHSWVMVGPENYTYSDLHVPGTPDGFIVQFLNEGVYEIRLTVVDDEGADDTEIRTVRISSAYAQCDNGIDDDGDGKVDWPADPHCHDAADPYEGEIVIPIAEKPFRDMDDLLVTRIDINGFDVENAVVEPGNYFRMSVGLQNNLDYTLDDVKVDVSIPELTVRSSNMFRELDPDESTTVVLNLEIPDGVAPGLYDLRVVVSNDDVRRVKYRTIAIV